VLVVSVHDPLRPKATLLEAVMPILDSAKERARDLLVGCMRSCIRTDRLPLSAKRSFINRSEKWLDALEVDDDRPVESEYGTKFRAGRDSSIVTSWLRFRQTYEPVLSEFILRHVHDGDVCVDAGANIGYFSVLLAKCVAPTGKVIAIEAAPDTARRLRANLELNSATSVVDVIEAACATQKGEITFYLHPEVDGWARLEPPAEGDPDRLYMGDTWQPVTVVADTLTAIVGADTERVSFIKLDVEGAETALTPQIVADFPHPRLVVALEVKTEIEATLRPFEEQGFSIYDLHNDYNWLYERKVPAITEAAYQDFYQGATADILLSRQPLSLGCTPPDLRRNL
jgi:FkbM family methyltransferase